MKPRIFISAVSSELKSARALVSQTLRKMGYEPVEQEIFGTESGDLRQMLREKINGCDGLIQLVGEAYGFEPNSPDADFGRVSYTQFEFLYARQQRKKTWLIFTLPNCTLDRPLDQLDLPPGTDPQAISALARAYQAERHALQQAYRDKYQTANEGHLWYEARSDDQLQLRVQGLHQLPSAKTFFRWQVATAALVLLSLFIGIYIANQQRKITSKIDTAKQELIKELSDPDALAKSIRQEIEATATNKIKALPEATGRWQKVAEIEKERDLALGRVDDLIKLIQAGLKAGATPIFQQATDILQKEGTDAALSYLELKRPSIVDTAKLRKHQLDLEKDAFINSLRPLALEAELNESKLQLYAALKLREQIAELAPDWFDARNDLGLRYKYLAEFIEAELHYQAAVKLADNPKDEAVALNNLGTLYHATNRLKEAESLLERALQIDEVAFGKEHPVVARDLNNLAQVYKATDRLKEAEPMMERALRIDEAAFGKEHPKVALRLNNLAQLYQATNRLKEAEPMMVRALKIDEAEFGNEHPNVARDLNNLAQLYQATNRLKEVEPLMKCGLAIEQKHRGANHPFVAIQLNNLARLYQDTNRLKEAEPLMEQALKINEAAYGNEHPTVAIALNNLATLYQSTNRLQEAEPLMRRNVVIFIKFGRATGHEHPLMQAALRNYRELLEEMKLSEDEIAAKMKSLEQEK